MSHQKVDSSFDPRLARVPRRPSESPMQSSRAHRTSVNTSPRPGAEAGLTHSPVTSTAPLGTTPASGAHWVEAGGGPGWSTKRPSFLVCRVKGSPRSQYPPSSAPTQITACSTGTPRQLALMNAPDIGTHLEAAQSCLSPRHPQPPSLFPSPTPNPPLNAGHRNKEEIRASPQIPPAQTSSPSTGPSHLGPFPPGSPLPPNWPLPSVSPVMLPRAGVCRVMLVG